MVDVMKIVGGTSEQSDDTGQYDGWALIEQLGHRHLAGWVRQVELAGRSEERRVGKECRSRWSPYH